LGQQQLTLSLENKLSLELEMLNFTKPTPNNNGEIQYCNVFNSGTKSQPHSSSNASNITTNTTRLQQHNKFTVISFNWTASKTCRKSGGETGRGESKRAETENWKKLKGFQ
jgi:hypothetical protein